MTPIRGRAHEYDLPPMADASLDPTKAHAAWKALQKAGGLVSSTDLRQRWGTPEEPLRRQTVHDLTSQDDFPDPVIEGGRGAADYWLAADVDEWRRQYDSESRRGPKPRRLGDDHE